MTWEQAVAYWRTLPSDPDAAYDKEVVLRTSDIAPQVTWGTSPEDVLPITGAVPDPAAASRLLYERAGQPRRYVEIDGANHAFAWHRAELRDLVTGWLTETGI